MPSFKGAFGASGFTEERVSFPLKSGWEKYRETLMVAACSPIDMKALN
jgi:hypothetical protein